MPAVVIAVVAVCCLALPSFAQDGVSSSLESARRDPDFAIQGEYTKDGGAIQVVAQGDGDFLIVVFKGGLPGAGWNGRDRRVIEGGAEDVTDLTEGYRKIDRQSPTLGASPPPGAVILFDGTAESIAAHWKDGARMTADGLLMQGATTKDVFQDFRFHVEFRTPYQPKARGQGRGNSGVYYQGRYETQVLDSFGLEGKQNETGGIYSIRKPDLNMCFPPLAWQTYDGEFRAARYKNGKKVSNAVLTVRLNGVTVQPAVELPHKTTAAPVAEGPESGPLYLQNHGNPVRYRNIWVQPIDAAREARRPLIPGFERFHATDQATAESGGRILVGELNCLSCHAAAPPVAKHILTKKAPILTDAATRLRSDYVWEFLRHPHEVRPGTTMPVMLNHLSEEEQAEAVTALTSFLVDKGPVKAEKPNSKWAQSGRRLFHEIGCVACHTPQNGKSANPATSIPLTALGRKYSLAGLAKFLQNPHAVRPSGRMPSFNLEDKQARDLAHFLAGDITVKMQDPNVRYRVFNQGFTNLPDLGELTPDHKGDCIGFDLQVANRNDQFSIRFESKIRIARSGEYKFHLGSDDGSFLHIDGKKIVDVDGEHPHTVKTGSVNLSEGVHTIVVDYSELGGEQSLGLEIEGEEIARQPIDPWLSLKEDGRPPKVMIAAEDGQVRHSTFEFRPELVAKGATLFGSLGCANCHELVKDGTPLKSTLRAPDLADCDPGKGCLAAQPAAGVPGYDLNRQQQTAIAAVVSAKTSGLTAEQSIQHTMKVFNCYACHKRGTLGGPEADRHALFVSRIPEMGDEGRIPPPLDGVGDKLQRSWLDHVLANGAKDRPYMLTRMPKFGDQAKGLANAFVSVDRQQNASAAQPDDVPHRVVTQGRKLVGSEGLSCVKCHIFGKYKASGIQALDLQTMARRINEDWFYKYLPKPEALRSGTRMPTAFPNGKSVVPEIYGGDPGQQMAAVWSYLKQGQKAKVPVGVIGGMIELKPTQRPVIYRNFISGLSPRGIAVGYPERAHLAWDCNRMALALIWHGRFIDAAKHWQGRGPGKQDPLGDNTLTFEATASLSVLESRDTPWPAGDPRERGYRFRGYRLDSAGRPAFRYATADFEVEDYPVAITANPDAVFERHIRITGQPSQKVYFRAATGKEIERTKDGWYVVDGAFRIRVRSAGDTFVRESGGARELLVPVTLTGGQVKLIQDIAW